MSNQTHLDRAHAQMIASPDDDTARLRFFERLIDAELFLALEAEADGDNIAPRLLAAEGQSFVLVFDNEDRLAEFVNGTAPFVALSGRALINMIAGQSLGLGLNLGVAPSEFLLPVDGVEWLFQTLGTPPQSDTARPRSFAAPKGVPEILLTALDQKLSTAQGLAQAAYLVEVTYDNDQRGHLLAFIGAQDGAQTALANAINEALVFCGLDAGSMDVTFLSAQAPSLAVISKLGLRFDLPEPIQAASYTPKAPGIDPDSPPKLR